jgi:hypothetical protein
MKRWIDHVRTITRPHPGLLTVFSMLVAYHDKRSEFAAEIYRENRIEDVRYTIDRDRAEFTGDCYDWERQGRLFHGDSELDDQKTVVDSSILTDSRLRFALDDGRMEVSVEHLANFFVEPTNHVRQIRELTEVVLGLARPGIRP